MEGKPRYLVNNPGFNYGEFAIIKSYAVVPSVPQTGHFSPISWISKNRTLWGYKNMLRTFGTGQAQVTPDRKMDYFDEINNAERFFVLAIKEIPNNGLDVLIVIPKIGEEKDIIVSEVHSLRGRPVTYNDQSPRYRITFERYIAYAVINESFDNGDPGIGIKGKYFRICDHSAFMEYVAKDTFATADYPGPFKHYQLLGQDHIINVVSEEEPVVEPSYWKRGWRSM